MKLQIIILGSLAFSSVVYSADFPWKWECINGFCQKTRVSNEDKEDTILSLPECRLVCSEYSAIWPKPTGNMQASRELVVVNPNMIVVPEFRWESPLTKLLSAISSDFTEVVTSKSHATGRQITSGLPLMIQFYIENEELTVLTLNTNESYLLVANTSDGAVHANISANTIFGIRHGLETLGQLIVYDDLRQQLKVPKSLSVEDGPVYPHRGIALDTSRNFITVDAIKRTINGMAASKLNSFHWHITDSQSFPYQSKSSPELSQLGAYSPEKVYSPEDIADIVEFAQQKGVRIIPEFDAPAHVGEGWQDSGFLVCFNAQPWSDYCVEPPCGQLDPTDPLLYDKLEGLYGDMLEQFSPDVFHMGGDEVDFRCWKSIQKITDWMTKHNMTITEEGFVQLWEMFQNETLQRVYKKAGKEIPVTLWTSTLTKPEYLHVLPKDKYIVQIWTLGTDEQVKNLLDNGYRIILSNYDALYFDCGFAAWVNDGNNWCSPYIGWQKVYENTPQKIAGNQKSQVLGAEAALWTEEVDETSVDSRLWPRAAAMAEVLWSEPQTTWRQAEQRFLVQRERLKSRQINADAVEPQWCQQYENNCPIQSVMQDLVRPAFNG